MYVLHCIIIIGDKKLPAPEYSVFQDHYAALTSLLFNTDISQYLVQARIITAQDQQKMSYPATDTEKAKYILIKISCQLQAGYAMSFIKLLEIMEKHGNDPMQELSATIQDKIKEIHKHKGQFD